MLKKFFQKIDTYRNQNTIVVIFFILWLVTNLIQAYFTKLASDEAYYWMYSRYLDWGYFDHPPMIAFLIKIGYSLFPNEFGVRLLPVLMGTSTIIILYFLMKDRISSISLFIMLAFSVIIFQSHVGGFLAIPDIPVVFFAALFYMLYKKYLSTDSVWLALMLGVVAACMIYSKYHGFLVLFFTLVSNLKIMKRWSFWLIPVVFVALLIPQIMWQINKNFPTIQFHLIGRSDPYRFDYTLNYLYSQILIAGPFIGGFLFYHGIRSKTTGDEFLRSMKFNFVGFFVLFFFTSFMGQVEAHWTAIAFIPLLIISFRGIQESKTAIKWIRYLFVPTILLILFVRIALIFEIMPAKWSLGDQFHGWDVWAQQVKTKADGRKVVFEDSFQMPSKFAFYSDGDFVHAINSIYYRNNQFDIWSFEDSIQGKKVMFFPGRSPFDSIRIKNYRKPERIIDNFRSYHNIKITTPVSEINSATGSTVWLELTIWNHHPDTLKIISSKVEQPPILEAIVHEGETFLPSIYLQTITDTIPPKASVVKKVGLAMPKKPGTYICNFAIVNDSILPAANSRGIRLIVK
jgi:hypothetical protein